MNKTPCKSNTFSRPTKAVNNAGFWQSSRQEPLLYLYRLSREYDQRCCWPHAHGFRNGRNKELTFFQSIYLCDSFADFGNIDMDLT